MGISTTLVGADRRWPNANVTTKMELLVDLHERT
jgi:hypothetical protein